MKIQLHTHKSNHNYIQAKNTQKLENKTPDKNLPLYSVNSEFIKANYMPVAFRGNEDSTQEYKTGFEGDVEPIDIDIYGPFEEEEDINFYDFLEAIEEITRVEAKVNDGNSAPYNITIEPDTVIRGELNIVYDSSQMPVRLKVMNFKAPYVDFQKNVYVRKADFKNFQMNEANGLNLHFADVRFIPDFIDEKSHNSHKEGARFDAINLKGELSFYNTSFSELNIQDTKAETFRMEKVPAGYDLIVKDCEFDNIDFMHVDFKSAPVFHNVKLTGGVYHHSENFGGSSFEQCYFEEGADFSGIDPKYLKNGLLSNCGYKDGSEDDFILPKGVEFEELGLYPQKLFFDTFNPEFQDIHVIFEEQKSIVTPEFKQWEEDSVFSISDNSISANLEIVENVEMEPVLNQVKPSETRKFVEQYFILDKDSMFSTLPFSNTMSPKKRLN